MDTFFALLISFWLTISQLWSNDTSTTVIIDTPAHAYQAAAERAWYNYEGANLSMANFSGSNVSGASFRYAQLDYANLSLARFNNADMTGVSLKYALIEYTEFNAVRGLTAQQLAEACINLARQDPISNINLQTYRLPSGCKIWEQVSRQVARR